MTDSLCPKCSSNMVLGYQVDGLGRDAYRQACWAEGPPEQRDAKFLGIALFEEWVLKVKRDDLRPIVTKRCSACGFLEHYAP